MIQTRCFWLHDWKLLANLFLRLFVTTRHSSIYFQFTQCLCPVVRWSSRAYHFSSCPRHYRGTKSPRENPDREGPHERESEATTNGEASKAIHTCGIPMAACIHSYVLLNCCSQRGAHHVRLSRCLAEARGVGPIAWPVGVAEFAETTLCSLRNSQRMIRLRM